MKAYDASYLAGFLDGDGSIHFQLVRQKTYRLGFYIRASMSFSQDTRYRWHLEQLRQLIGSGYVRDRGTGMSDLVTTSRPVLIRILGQMAPFVIVKKRQVTKALALLPQIQPRLEAQEFLRLAYEVDAFSSLNHSKTKRVFAVDVEAHLRGTGLLTPVTTSSNDFNEEMGFLQQRLQIYGAHNTPAPRNRVKV